VFGCAFKFGEDREGVASRISERVMNFEQNGSVALNNEGTVWIHNQPVYASWLSLPPQTRHASW
jgi:hypothetical protein